MELAPSEDLHVLCVDDDPEAVELTATYLREEFPVATVTADRSRLQQLFENPFRDAVEHDTTSSGSHARRDPAERNSGGPQRAEKSVERGRRDPARTATGVPP